jgi:spermidine synthase
MINNQTAAVNQRALLVVVFFSGLVTLAVELTAFRLFAPVFGATNLISAVVIGLILLYLSAGYLIGGRWADRSPNAITLYGLVAWGAFLIGLIPFIALPLLRLARAALQDLADVNLAVVVLAFIVTIILFAAPVTLLGCVSPFAVRLSVRQVDRAGHVAGRLFAVSTLGSFIGSFLPELLLLDLFGTRGTFVFLALLLMSLALLLLRRAGMRLIWMPIVLVALNVLLPLSFSDLSGTVYQGESGYNYIQVIERDGVRSLLLNEGQGIHSIYDPRQTGTNRVWDYFTIAPYFNAAPFDPGKVKRLAIVGLAGGTVARLYTDLYGPLPIDGIEIDPKIVQVGRAYFGMTQPNLHVLVGDGRAVLAASPYRYDVIALDAYRVPYIPWHLTTREFMQEVADHLTEIGVVAINVGHTRRDTQLVDAIAQTAAEVFPSVHIIDVPNTLNSIIYATLQPTAFDNLRANLDAMPSTSGGTPAVWRNAATQALARQRQPDRHAPVLTDNRAPIEQMTNAMLLDFFLGNP